MISILLVDDSPTILLSVKAMLEKGDMTVETASGGQQALDRLAAGFKPELIITDINMPGMDGVSFVAEVRRAGHRFTPILVLTTESDHAKRAEAKAAGATAWLVKPVSYDAIVDVIHHVLPAA